jgi:hypothetical protein
MIMRKKEATMVGVQEELMIMRNKRRDKNSCAEEVDNDEERSDRMQNKLMIMRNKSNINESK